MSCAEPGFRFKLLHAGAEVLEFLVVLSEFRVMLLYFCFYRSQPLAQTLLDAEYCLVELVGLLAE